MPPRDFDQMTTEQKRSVVDTMIHTERTAYDTTKVQVPRDAAMEREYLATAKQNADFIQSILGDMDTTRELHITEAEEQRLNSIRTRGLSHLLLNERSRSDSAEMKEVKLRVGKVERILDELRAEPLTKEIYETIEVAYQLAIDACNSYIQNPKKRHNRRWEAVRDTYTAYCQEAFRLDALREQFKNGEMEGKVVADLIGLDSGSGVLVQREVKKSDEKPAEISSSGKEIAMLFSRGYVPHKSVLAEGSDPEDRMYAVKEIMELKKTLRRIPEGRVTCFDTELLGVKVKLLQRSDNSLVIVEGHTHFKLELSAPLLADKIEADMVNNRKIYGNDALHDMFAGLTLEKNGKKVSSGERQRIRQLCLDYIEKTTKIAAPEFTNVSPETLLEYARKLSAGTLDAKGIRQALKEISSLDDIMINSAETLEMVKQSKARKVNAVTFTENEEGRLVDPAKEWSEKEKQILEMFAECIFERETWNADENDKAPEKQGDLLRKRLGKHKAAMVTLIKEPDLVRNMLKKLNIPGIKDEDGKNIGDSLSAGYEKLIKNMALLGNMKEDYLRAEILDKVFDEKAQGVNLMFGLVSITPDEIFEMFDDYFASTSQMVDGAMTDLQKTVSEASADIFGAEDEAKEVAVRNDNKTELQKMAEELVKGKKGAGKFNKLILNNYFERVSELDKRTMIASMVRNVKPEGWARRSREEYCQELRTSQKYKDSKYSFDPARLTAEEEKILKEYQEQSIKELMSGNLLGGILKGAGPLMHKVMQGLPLEGMPVSLREALKDMKSNLAPIPREIVSAQLNAMVERSKGSITRIEVVKSLGAASIAQTFLCKCYGRKFPEGKEVAVKILRPDVRNRMMREKQIMIDCAKATDESGGMEATYKGILDNVEREMDFTIEAGYVKAGAIYNNKHDDVQSMKLNDIIEPTTGSMVADKADGTTVDRYLADVDKKIQSLRARFYEKKKDKDGNEIIVPSMELRSDNIHLVGESVNELREELARLEKRRNHLCNLADIWVREGMMKSGFYHGDLHSGNIMIDDDKATVIDFGNSTQLTPKQQKHIIGMLTAAMSGDTNLFMLCFKVLLGRENDEKFMEFFNEAKQAELKEAFRQVLSLGDEEEAGERIVVALLKAQELGVEVPASIWGFAQGQSRIMNSINEMNEKMRTVQEAISAIEGINTKLNHRSTEVDPVLSVQRTVYGRYLDEDQQEETYARRIRALSYTDMDQMLADLNDTKKTKNRDGIQEFENKYLHGMRYASRVLQNEEERPGVVKKGVKQCYTWAGEEDPEAVEKAVDHRILDKVKRLKAYRDKYKDDRNNPARNIEAQGMLDLFSPKHVAFVELFGGQTMSYMGIVGVSDMNVEQIDKVLDFYGNRLPMVRKMINAYEEFRLAQKDKAGQEKLDQLKQNLVDSYMDLEKSKNDNNEVLNVVRLALYPTNDNAKKDAIKKSQVDETIKAIADERYGQLSVNLTTAYNKFRALQEKETNKEKLSEDEKKLYNVQTVEEARIKAEKEFIEAYRLLALARLNEYKQMTLSGRTKEPADRDFLNVMRDILTSKTLVVRMAWKVRWKLGWKIFRSKSNAKKQKADHERSERAKAAQEAQKKQAAQEAQNTQAAANLNPVQGNGEGGSNDNNKDK